jgi:hypothetical protein
MLSRLSKVGRSVPNLVVAQRVIDKMNAAAKHYIQDETGEAMIGLLVPGKNTNGIPTLYVLDTIAPDESAVRQFATFQQGDERQDELIWWLQENWQHQREKRRSIISSILSNKWDEPLRYLGDWHKQPGYMIQPSGGDRMTALRWVDDDSNGMDFLLTPIVTLDHPSTTANPDANTNFLLVPQKDGTSMRIDFWYIDAELRMFLPILPTIYPDDQLPTLAQYPWHLTDQQRFQDESTRLQDDGLFTTLVLWNVDDDLPLEICFLTARIGADRVLLIVTAWDYPKRAPWARIAPFVSMGVDDDVYAIFEELWAKSEPVADPADWLWTPEKHLLDYIQALEKSLGIERPAPPVLVTSSIEPDGVSADKTENQTASVDVDEAKDTADVTEDEVS